MQAQAPRLLATCAASAMFLLGASKAGAQPEYDFILVDSFNANPLAGETRLSSINDSGVACGVATVDNVIGYPGFVWNQATGKTLVPVSSPESVSNNGLVVGIGSVYDLTTHQSFSPPNLPGTYYSPHFGGVNDAGVAVGSISVTSGSDSGGILRIPYIWDAVNGARTIGVPNAKSLHRINNAGVALGWMNDLTSRGPFFVNIESGAYTALIDLFPPGIGVGYPYATDINDYGQVVGSRPGTYPISRYGYVYSPTTGLRILPFPGNGYQQYVAPTSINNAGTIVGTISTTLASQHVFVYSAADGLRDLNTGSLIAGMPTGYRLYVATKINNRGWIVGYGSTAAGKVTGFVLRARGAVCDSIDFNNDSLLPDTQDIDDLLTVFSGGACSTGDCGDIDFNNDGLFPDTADLDAFLRVFSGGPCS